MLFFKKKWREGGEKASSAGASRLRGCAEMPSKRRPSINKGRYICVASTMRGLVAARASGSGEEHRELIVCRLVRCKPLTPPRPRKRAPEIFSTLIALPLLHPHDRHAGLLYKSRQRVPAGADGSTGDVPHVQVRLRPLVPWQTRHADPPFRWQALLSSWPSECVYPFCGSLLGHWCRARGFLFSFSFATD